MPNYDGKGNANNKWGGWKSGTTLSNMAGVVEGTSAYVKGSAARTSASFEAMQQYQNAKRRLRAGEVEAQGFRQQGRVMQSDATVAMIAQGGTVDAGMLAKLKTQSDIDAISAMYDAKADAITMQSAARMKKIEGRSAYRQGQIALGSSVLTAAGNWKW